MYKAMMLIGGMVLTGCSAQTKIGAAFDHGIGEVPFANGAMSIVATEHGTLRTYRLVPCHSGIVCAGSERGRHGRLEQTEDYTVVRGLYGRTFWLSRGGDGVLQRGSHGVTLAWDSDVVQIGAN